MPIDPRKFINKAQEEGKIFKVLAFSDAEFEKFTDLLLQDDDIYNEFRAAETRAKLEALASKK